MDTLLTPPTTTETPSAEAALSYEDFARLYADRHAEWEVGKVIIPVNNFRHQQVLIFLVNLFSTYLKARPVGQLMLAGFSMYVGPDQPAREPDLMVILNENLHKLGETRLNGTADVVVEVVSPESSARDYVTKFEEYQRLGIPEYWLIDPQRQVADIFRLDAQGLYRRSELDGQGRLVSHILAGFALPPALLWDENFPAGADLVALVQTMLS
jgi:Uma2 family endonuclease